MTRKSFFISAAMLAVIATSYGVRQAVAVDDGLRIAQAAEPQNEQRRPPGQRPGQAAPGQQGRPPAPNATQHPPGAAAPPAQHTPPAAAVPPAQHTPPAAAIPPAQHTPPAAAAPPVQPVPPAAAAPPARPVPPVAQPNTPQRPGAAPAVAPTAQTPPNPQPQRPGTPQTPPAAAAQTPPNQLAPRPGAPAAPPPPAAAQAPGRPGAPAAAVAPAPAPLPGGVRPGPQQANTPPAQPPAAQAPQGQRPPAAAVAVVPPRPVDPKTMPQHLEQLRSQRQEVQEGNRTVIREADRTIIREGGHDIIRHDEAARFGFNAREVNVEHRGNATITVALRPDGSRIVTEVDDNGRLLRRVRRDAAGREVIIIDNTVVVGGPGFAGPGLAVGAGLAVGGIGLAIGGPGLFVDLAPPVIRIAPELYIRETVRATPDEIYLTLAAPPVERIDRRYTLDEIRYSEPLRGRMPRVDIDTVNFEFGSWEIAPDQIERLAGVAQGIKRAVERNPAEVFLIEGHTDAVGNDVDNLSLSDHRAESVAVVLTNQFGVPPENLTSQGYGKQFLKIPTPAPERANRRVAVRRITPLLTAQN
jgi:outer membrane protein OmpA-like peptidoglycan-associated protein